MKCWVASIFVALGERVAVGHRRQAAAFVVLVVVAAFLVEREEAVEADDLAGGAQIDRARAGFGDDVDRGALELGRFHLARDGALPDQFVEPRLLGLEAAARHASAGG